jgi:TonB-linked SusC/RagA family outer membrane protein
MKLLTYHKVKNIPGLFLLIVLMISLSVNLTAQKNVPNIDVTGKVSSESGEAIAGAMVYTDQTSETAMTGSDGTFTITAAPDDLLFIEAKRFKTVRINVKSLNTGENAITLSSLPYKLGEQDEVLVPFGRFKERQIVSPAYTIKADEILGYDQRRSVEGILNTRLPGLFGNLNNRGIGNSLIIVDGVPRPADNINIHEVDEITYLPDGGARLLYGTQADNGIILIKTKRGHPYKRSITVSAEQGIDVPISYPSFLNSYDYARLYNEASMNDGLSPRYDSAALNAYQNGTNPYLYPDEDYYNERFLKSFRPFTSVITEFSGGNEQAQYYMNLGWNSSGTLLTVGEGANERSDRFNIRGNVDFKVTENIKMNLDIAGAFNRNHGASGNFWSDAAAFLPNYYPVLIDTSDIYIPDPGEITRTVEGGKLIGGTSQYQDNIYGDLVFGGYVDVLDRVAQFNTGFDIDLNDLLYGLTDRANLSFDIYNFFRVIQSNDYAVYEPRNYNEDTITVNKIGEDNPTGSQRIGGSTFYRTIGYYGTLDYNRMFGEDHLVNATALAYTDQYITEGEIHPELHFNVGLRANYIYRNKYIAEITAALPGSQRLAPGNRFRLAHSVGLAWVLTEEDFLSSSSLINYMKIRASHTVLNTTQGMNDYFMYNFNYEQGSRWEYADGAYGNNVLNILNIGNPLLTFAQRRDINAGVVASLLDYKLQLTANYFYSNSFGEVASMSNLFPAYLGGLDVYENYESFLDQGADLGLNYLVQVNDFELNLGLNAVYSVPKVLQIDEPNYEYEYRSRLGKPSDAIFGWVADGFYTADDFNPDGSLVEGLPIPAFGAVQPGDIKYTNLNEDNVIDENDQQVIGNSSARLQTGLNLHLRYKNIEFFTQAIYQAGGNSIYDSDYYWVYGDLKYSDVVLDRWTEETAETATYPRLSTQNNSNNFRRSTFWLVDDDYFTLRAMQLTYSLPEAWMSGLPTSRIKMYLRGQNLLTLSPSKAQRELNIGNAPQFRNYSFGISLTF